MAHSVALPGWAASFRQFGAACAAGRASDADEGRRRLTLGVSEQGVAEDEGAGDGGGTGEEIAACVHGVLLS